MNQIYWLLDLISTGLLIAFVSIIVVIISIIVISLCVHYKVGIFKDLKPRKGNIKIEWGD